MRTIDAIDSDILISAHRAERRTIPTLLAKLANSFAARVSERRARLVLLSFNDRQLADIGVSRCDAYRLTMLRPD